MKVLVAGGTGFIGSYLCRALADGGSRGDCPLQVAERYPRGSRPRRATLPTTTRSPARSRGQDAVVNLVALSPLFEPKGGNVMHDRIHRKGTENLVRAAEEGGAERFLQLSALGADPDGDTAYIRAKGQAEEIVRESGLGWTIFRPSVVFGEGGEFVSFTKRLKGMFAPGLPLYPLPGGGKTRFQPIHVEDPRLDAGRGAGRGRARRRDLRDRRSRDVDAQAGDRPRVRGRKEGSHDHSPADAARPDRAHSPWRRPGFPMGADQYRSLKFDNTTAHNDVEAFGVDPAELTTLGEHLGVV